MVVEVGVDDLWSVWAGVGMRNNSVELWLVFKQKKKDAIEDWDWSKEL